METFTQQLILITDSIISAPLAYCKQYNQIALLPLTSLPINPVIVFPIFLSLNPSPLIQNPVPTLNAEYGFSTNFRPSDPLIPLFPPPQRERIRQQWLQRQQFQLSLWLQT